MLLAMQPMPLTTAANGPPGRAATMRSARTLSEQKLRQLQAMAADADVIIAVCQFLYDALLRNGIPEKKIKLNRQGITAAFAKDARGAAYASPNSPADPLRLLYLGRWDPVKGIDVAVNAVRAIPSAIPVQLSIRAVAGHSGGGAFERQIRNLAKNDPRISVDASVPRAALPELLGYYDVLIVPSRWLETGPMVVLEARAAGLYVVGSNFGGIAELVRD